MPPSKGLSKLRADMTKAFGDKVTRRDDMTRPVAVPTGSITLDHALRIGGLALRRTHEILGPEGVGKTSLCTLIMASAQKMFPDRGVALIDMEQSFDFAYAQKLGLDLDEDRFVHIYPDHSEDVADIAKMLLRSGDISVVCLDSIGGMESKAAFEKSAEDSAMGKNSQVISRMVKQVASLCRAKNAMVIFVNQYRADIGNPRGGQKSAGPNILKYCTTTKIELKRTGEPVVKVPVADAVSESVKDEEIGRQLRAKVVRNKFAPPGRAADFWLFSADHPTWGPIGIDRADEALNLGIATGAIERINASKYGLPDGTHIVGRANVKQALREKPELTELVRQRALLTVSGEIVPEHEVTYDDEEYAA
ncbi:hypothetical protein [Kitasatospora viridis]|uniref:Protein RecA n=1 Tax=Kitasatospora viridis TaxID=281105 RepID=A0A561SA81_9ACTN|nr:hypothetical protein [Kitasatospora viridis]TWF71786.1 recombination protein RecA [Kitasatospora viridis]